MNSESFATLPYILSVIGIFNGFIFGLYLLFAKPGRRIANILLGIFFIFISFRIFRSWFVLYHGYTFWISRIAHILVFIAGPVMFNYFKIGLRGVQKITYIDFLFLIPMSTVFFANFKIIMFCTFGSMLFYLTLSALIFKEYLSSSTKNNRLIPCRDFIWYRNLIVIIFISIIAYTLNIAFKIIPYITGAIGYSILIYAMVYYWNKHQNIKKQKKDYIKYKNTKQIQSAHNEQIICLEKFMKDKKGYKDYTLTLGKLAEMLGVTPHQLSQLINQDIGKSFTDYINEYRINEAKELLVNPEYELETVENIGYESGFSNTSSFYSAFKKFTGTSPSKYRKEIL